MSKQWQPDIVTLNFERNGINTASPTLALQTAPVGLAAIVSQFPARDITNPIIPATPYGRRIGFISTSALATPSRLSLKGLRAIAKVSNPSNRYTDYDYVLWEETSGLVSTAKQISVNNDYIRCLSAELKPNSGTDVWGATINTGVINVGLTTSIPEVLVPSCTLSSNHLCFSNPIFAVPDGYLLCDLELTVNANRNTTIYVMKRSIFFYDEFGAAPENINTWDCIYCNLNNQGALTMNSVIKLKSIINAREEVSIFTTQAAASTLSGYLNARLITV